MARRRREEEAQLERKNPLQQFVELLSTQDEAAWKDFLIGMGQGPDVPRLFKLRCAQSSRLTPVRKRAKVVVVVVEGGGPGTGTWKPASDIGEQLLSGSAMQRQNSQQALVEAGH